MKRYKVNLGLNISAESKKEAYKIIKEIIESGNATTKKGTFVSISLSDKFDPKAVEELLF